MKEVMNFVKALKYDDTPNYNKLRNILKTGLSREGQKNEWVIDFGSQKVKFLSRCDFIMNDTVKKKNFLNLSWN